jgi:single-stranded DNA-binding protein
MTQNVHECQVVDWCSGYRLDVDAWSPLAEQCQQFARKGMQFQMHGSLKYDEWKDKKTGSSRSKVSLTVSSIYEVEPVGVLTCMPSPL